MAAQMFDFHGLREFLIDQAALEFEWDELDESQNVDENEILYEMSDSLGSPYQCCITERISSFEHTNTEKFYDKNTYLGQDKSTKWSRLLPQYSESSNHKVFSETVGPNDNTLKTENYSDYFLLFFSDNILETIVKYTNIYIEKFRSGFSRTQDCKCTNVDEIKSLIGLLILTGLLRTKNQKLDELWEPSGLGVNAFRLTMNIKRFKFLLSCIHFDDIRDREIRVKTDNLAMIREIFELFTNNCKNNYTVGENVTINEQMIEYKGKCPSDLYSKSKLSKYGIKIYSMFDTESFYVSVLHLHVKKQPSGPYCVPNSSKDIIDNLVSSIKGSGRTVSLTHDFCDVSLMDILLQSDIFAHCVVNKNEEQIPIEFTIINDRKSESNIIGFNGGKSLLSHITSDNKNLLLLSTCHYQSKTEAESLIIQNFNRSMLATETIDKLINNFSISRRTRRFSMAIWFYMLNVACLNSFIIYYINNNSKISRREFLKEIGLSLIKHEINSRMLNKNLPRQLREDAAHFLSLQLSTLKIVNQPMEKAKRCSICPRNRDIKVRTFCFKCNLPMCKNHMNLLCGNCFDKHTDNE